MRYLAAFSNGASDDTALITSVASPAGTLGGHNVWTDITGFVRSSRWARGRQHEQGRFEAGEAVLDMQNEDGRFNPWNTAGPYFGLLAVGVPLQILSTWASVTTKQFTGNLHTFKPKWPSNFNSDVEFVAQDAFRLLALANIHASEPYAPVILADHPTNYWRLGEATGTTAADLGSAPNNGTYAGSGIQGVSPGALVNEPLSLGFDTLTGAGYVTYATPQPFPAATFSIEFWIKLHSPPGGSFQSIYNIATGTGSPDVNVYVTLTGGNVGFGWLLNDGTRSQNNWTGLVSNAADGNWHHVVMVRTGGLAFVFYVDGVTYTSVPIVNTGTTVFTGSGRGEIGLGLNGITPSGFWQIQELAIYNTPLTATQVTNHYNTAATTAAWSGQTSGQRINKVLDAIAWPAGNRSIDTGDATNPLSSYTGGLTTKALKHMQDVERTENGALFVTKDGIVKFVSYAHLITTPYTTVQSVFGDRPLTPFFELPYQPDLDFGEDDLDLYTVVVASNAGDVSPNVITVLDSTAVARYGYRALDLTGLLGTSSTALNTRANAALTQYKVPLTRVRQVQILPLDSPAALFPEVLARELLDLIQVTRTGIPGSPLVASTTVEHIEHIVDARAGTWVTHYGLGQALAPA